MTVRRRRQHPHDFGRASTFVETIDNPVLEHFATRFLSAIDYYGLAEVEFKIDPRDGQFKLHDVNTRTWGYHTLGLASGVNFPALLFADQLGLPVRPCSAVPGKQWVRLVTDIPSSLLDIMKGRLKPGEYLASMSSGFTEAVFSVTDPLPGLVELALLPYLMYKRGF
jgi:predicted ATP-grasp superfamily ATP-dependent carboligase